MSEYYTIYIVGDGYIKQFSPFEYTEHEIGALVFKDPRTYYNLGSLDIFKEKEVRKYAYKPKVVKECFYCGRDILETEDYLVTDEKEDEVACTDCYTDNRITAYFVGGEYVGTDEELYVKYTEF